MFFSYDILFTVLTLHKETIILIIILTTTTTTTLPLLATTGAASVPYMRRFLIGFLAKSQKTLLPYTLLNIFHINPRYFLFLCIFFTVLNLHKETIILTTATTTHTEFFPLLATTGSARSPRMRRFSLQFFEK